MVTTDTWKLDHVFEQNSHIAFEGITMVFMNAAIFADTTPCGPYVSRRFGATLSPLFSGP
jgi:hypothetical protein